MLKEEFQIHETLNKKLWDITTKKLLPEVREKILDIVFNFEEYINVPIDILDVQLVGSNASYNYTDHSDLDVHIIANFDVPDYNKELLQALYDIKKKEYNKRMNISLRGIEIEIYVQDVKTSTISNGIYSVCEDSWVKEPKPIKSVTKHNTEKEVKKWSEKISSVISSKNYDLINDTINSLYLIRHNSIAADGEYGKGNQIFKDIRNTGLLDELKYALYNSLSTKLSLESLTQGQVINRFNE